VRRSISTLGRFLIIMHEAFQGFSKLEAKGGAVVTSPSIGRCSRTSHRIKVARPWESFVEGLSGSLPFPNARARKDRATRNVPGKHLPLVPAGKLVDQSAQGKNILAFTGRGRSSRTQHPNRSFERTHTGGARVQVFLSQGTPVCAAQFRR